MSPVVVNSGFNDHVLRSFCCVLYIFPLLGSGHGHGGGGLEHINLATGLTPDLLHQLYQGIFKSYLLWWIQFLVGIKELDQWFASTTQVEGMRHFTKGLAMFNSGLDTRAKRW
jgi:hypothetical protein